MNYPKSTVKMAISLFLLTCFTLFATDAPKKSIATNKILGTFSIDKENLQIDLINEADHDVMIRGFFEGLTYPTVLNSASVHSIISREQMIIFNSFNHGRLLIHLKKDPKVVSTMSNRFDYNYKITNTSFLNLIEKNKVGEKTTIEVECYIAVNGTKNPDEYQPTTITLKFVKE